MARPTLSRRPTALRELVPVLAFGAGLVSLFSGVQILGQIWQILECSGAVGGTRPAAQ